MAFGRATLYHHISSSWLRTYFNGILAKTLNVQSYITWFTLTYPPTTLQYTDDTLIFTKASPEAASTLQTSPKTLRQLLDFFNFPKTIFVPMNVTTYCVVSIATTLKCQISAFPQIYIGMPLSPNRLPSNAFLPILQICHKYHASWKAKPLDKGDWLMLLSVVLDSLATYFMSVFSISKKVLKQLDAFCRVFFWATEETCTGAQSLIT